MLKVILNPDKKVVAEVKARLRETNNYCPCKLKQNENTKCMCKEFREQTEPGECCCGLYCKVVSE